MEGTRPNAYDFGGHPAPYGGQPYPTPYKCSQNVKVKVKINTNAVLALAFAEVNKFAEINKLDFDSKHFDRIYKVG